MGERTFAPEGIAPVTTIVKTACPHDCPDTCSMLATVEDGQTAAGQRQSG